MGQLTTQARIVSQDSVNPSQAIETIAFFDEDGAPVSVRTDADELQGVVTTATVIGTAAKTTTSAEPAAGSIVPVKFTNGNSATSPTLAFAGGAARAMQLGGTASAAAKLAIAANGIALFYFDGTILHQVGAYT